MIYIKYLKLAVLWLVLELFAGATTMALDIDGYLDNRFQINDNDSVGISNKARLELEEKAEQYYMLVAINGYYEAAEETTANKLELNRAYLDLKHRWGKTTIGLQNLAWGSGYYFNLPDIFNTLDPTDPKGEKAGVSALDVKWNFDDTAFFEGVFLPDWQASKSDFGLRTKCTLGMFDFFLSNVRKFEPNELVYEREATIAECHGEIGKDYPGIWLQTAYTEDTYTDKNKNKYHSFVVGIDYTIPFGNGWYCLGEYCRNGIIESSKQLFFSFQHDFRSYLSAQLNLLVDCNTDAALYSLKINYYIFDKVELANTINYYPEGSNKIGMTTIDVNLEYVFGVKLTF